MDPSLHIHIADRAAVMGHYDPQRIHGCCATCPMQGHSWSCPPFDELPLMRFGSWDHAVLVSRKIWTEPGATHGEMVERFHATRRGFRSLLLAAEARCPGASALVAGHCPACETCARPEPCRNPSALRYSLEAAGFDVTGLAEGLAGQKVSWPADGLPDYLLSVGALLCLGRQCAEELGQALSREA